MKIFYQNGNETTTEELRADVEASKQKFHPEYGYAFTANTVEALLDTIEVLEHQLDAWITAAKK